MNMKLVGFGAENKTTIFKLTKLLIEIKGNTLTAYYDSFIQIFETYTIQQIHMNIHLGSFLGLDSPTCLDQSVLILKSSILL